jgi:predicted RND superfamily exporter protein
MNGIIVLSQFNFLVRGGMERTQAVLQTGALQIRPVLMTCVIAGVGLLPAAISTGIGSQVQKPLAIVVVSGMTLAPILILIVLPALIAFFPRHTSSAGRLQAQAEPTRIVGTGDFADTPNLSDYLILISPKRLRNPDFVNEMPLWAGPIKGPLGYVVSNLYRAVRPRS